MRKIIISGPPHSGKTTLLEALKHEYPEAYFVPQPAEMVIARELARQVVDKNYTPVVPWLDYSIFGPVVTSESLMLEAAIPFDTDVVFQDRSLIDTIAYCQVNNFEAFIPEVRRHVEVAHYTLTFFCEPVGEYKASAIRHETAKSARKIHDYLVKAYEESELLVVYLPAVSIDERIKIVCQSVN